VVKLSKVLSRSMSSTTVKDW